MRLLASAMVAAAGLGTAAAVALVARPADPPDSVAAAPGASRSVSTAPTRTVVRVVSAPRPRSHEAKGGKGTPRHGPKPGRGYRKPKPKPKR